MRSFHQRVLLGNRGGAELAEYSQHVHFNSRLDDLSIDDSIDGYAGKCYPLAGGWNAEECAVVCPVVNPAGRHVLSLYYEQIVSARIIGKGLLEGRQFSAELGSELGCHQPV